MDVCSWPVAACRQGVLTIRRCRLLHLDQRLQFLIATSPSARLQSQYLLPGCRLFIFLGANASSESGDGPVQVFYWVATSVRISLWVVLRGSSKIPDFQRA